MASVQEHIDSIERFEKFLQFLKRDGDYPEWAVVAVFYIAVHYSRALLSHANVVVTSHRWAAAEFHNTFHDRKCYTHLETLKRQAEKARYDNACFSWLEVDRLINNQLSPLKSCVRKLSDARGLSLPT